ncbi:MAG TPA: VanZ family protein, partial [Syntrophomonas sp.]|nr:VanZ family protein [Syntrophomonas sp.]
SIFTGNANINIGFFDEGLSPAMILNIVLFIPFGFFSMLMFNSLQKSWIRGVLFGLIFSVTIEFLQTFIGRFAQLDDVLMNTIGVSIGCEISIILLKLNQKRVY